MCLIPTFPFSNDLKPNCVNLINSKLRAYIHTKLESIEHGEKLTRYFYNALRQQQARHTFSHIYLPDESEDTTVSSTTQDILSQATSFYQTLYTRDESVSTQDHSILFNLLSKQVLND